MIIHLLNLFRTNRKLEKRLPQSEWFYALIIGLFCTFIFIFTGFITINTVNELEHYRLFNLLAYMVIMFDISLSLMKFGEKAIVEPKHLIIYPISKWDKYKFHSISLLNDYKTLIYISAAAISAILLLSHSLYIEAFISIFVWFLLLVVLVTWTLVFYQMGGKYLLKRRKQVQLISTFIFISFLLGINMFGMMELINEVPLISNIGAIIQGFMTGNHHSSLSNGGYLLGALFLGLFIYKISPSNY